MATRIRTLSFLPDVFRTPTNAQFLQATLDQLVDQPNLQRIEGYIGSKFGYGINAKNKYVTEPTKTRTDYQLDPGVVFLKNNTSTAKDFISYPGIIDALKVEGGLTEDNSRLFNSEFYSWDSFTDLDKIINFNEYYWLPSGPQAVVVESATVYNAADYTVDSVVNGYNIYLTASPTDTNDPLLTLLRGGTYTFAVNQPSQFWIQGEPGVTGFSASQPNLQTRDVFGVTNNGAETGFVTFTVPSRTAQDEYNFPGNNIVDVVSTLPYDQINGVLASDLGNIDGITSLNGLTLMFYNNGIPNEQGFISRFYDTTTFDQIDPALIDGFGNYEGGYYTDTAATFYTIVYEGELSNPVIRLVEAGTIPTEEKITAVYGTQWVARNFFRDSYGFIELIPYISAPLSTLYYQDGTSSNKVGKIKLIESNAANTLNILTDILGKKTFTSTNGVVFTNGLKVIFQGDIYPTSYKNKEFYVEGVGTSIELVAVVDLVVPELFSNIKYIPFDSTAYDIGNYDSDMYVTVLPDYITIARNAINKNAWARSNRWFHIDVINATAIYNNNPDLINAATHENKAKRPIIEFYPNLSLFNSGIIGKTPVDFFDFRTTDAFALVAGQPHYYPDVTVATGYTASINGVYDTTSVYSTSTIAVTNTVGLDIAFSNTNGWHVNDQIIFTSGTNFGGLLSSAPPLPTTVYYVHSIIDNVTFTVSASRDGPVLDLSTASGSLVGYRIPMSTTLTVASSDIAGKFLIGQFVTDSANVLPINSYITAVTGVSTLTITVSWSTESYFDTVDFVSIVATDTTNNNYALFEGARIVFAADTNLNVRNKIYVANFSSVIESAAPVITLTEAENGTVLVDEQTVAYRGYNYVGETFYFDGSHWVAGQQKISVNQAPLFNIYDENDISLSDQAVYLGSSFKGTKLFSYGIGTGTNDSILGFPIRYSSVDNVGDISFDVNINLDTFNYVNAATPITQNVNLGYVFNYTSANDHIRQLGWQTAIAPSVQYQVFEFNYLVSAPTVTYVCDIQMSSATDSWPCIQVYLNNVFQIDSAYTVSVTDTTTTVTFVNPEPLIDNVIQILLLSKQVSANAYYSLPINLNNNPLNADVTSVNIGDIRGQYQSIFYNAPGLTGTMFGSNNYRDSGSLVSYGSSIIQNSASLVLPATFLRKQNHNLINALLFNSREYITFKSLLVDTINNTEYSVFQTAASMLDDALDQITATKTGSGTFFWSDMLPAKAAYITNTYSFANSLDISIYPLSRIYEFAKANYFGVLVYLVRSHSGFVQTTQLISGIDYSVGATSPTLTISLDLLPGDQIIIKEYNQTYGNYVPNTPTKLGLYPSTIPNVLLDSSYSQPTYFIIGHDGSYNKLYGDYDPVTGRLVDFRDQALLEFEKRIYNNLKLSNTIPISEYEILPGFFRDTDYSYNEILQIYSECFLNWVGQNRIDYKTQYYMAKNEFTYNYRSSGNKINGAPIEQGYWRGVYEYFYDTSTPESSPWEMLGLTEQPTWWETRYGAAPYTSDNLVLWNDLAQGINWNNGIPVVIPHAIRPELLEVLPVDSFGNLVSPFISIVGNYYNQTLNHDWLVGDVGPAEFSYRRSSSWPFDLMRILALTKPAQFFNLAVDIDNYKYNEEFGQYLVNNRSHLVISDVEIYGSGTAKTSYLNWIVDYEKQLGIDATQTITELLGNLDVRLVHRLAGFSDKNMLKFYVEKSTPNSNNSSLLIPDESYAVLLYDNQPFNRIVYSSVTIQIIPGGGYKLFGNSQTNAYFTAMKPKINGNYTTVHIDNLRVQLAKDYYDDEAVIPYGIEFFSVQEVAQFLESYGRYLQSQGMIFDKIENGIEITWSQMVAEFLYWAQTGWEIGSIINVNPAAKLITINKDSNIVQPLTLQQQNFVLNQNLYPIQSIDLAVVRDGTLFSAEPLNAGDTIAYGTFNISSIEHGIVFDNVTVFNDVIYNLTTGLRQDRIVVRGSKTADWTGIVDAQGFILNQDNINDWTNESKYTTGSIVKYKNKYWIATEIVQARELFDEKQWKRTDYNEIQKGLLPNPSTRSYESTLYYNVNVANLEKDADLLSFSLIGFRPRDYLAVADLTDITQINVYKNMIKNKGTKNAVNAFKGATLPQGGIDYNIYENWAIKSGDFGGVLNNNFVELRLNESELTGNPSIVGLSRGTPTAGVQQEVQTYSLFNYGRLITSPEVLPLLETNTPSTLYPDAGYVNFDDVKMSSYFYSGMATAVDAAGITVPLSELYVRDYVWIANNLGTWQVYTPVTLGQILMATNNRNGTVTIAFVNAHNLTKYQSLAIVNLNPVIDGYYIAMSIVDPFTITINLNLNPTISSVAGNGIGFHFQSQRIEQPSNAIDLPLLDSEFIKNTVWVDTNTDGEWAVYRKGINYAHKDEVIKSGSQSFGEAVAYSTRIGNLISDPNNGEAYRYKYNAITKDYLLTQTLPGGRSMANAWVNGTSLYVINSSVTLGPMLPNMTLTDPTGLLDGVTIVSVASYDNDTTLFNISSSLPYTRNLTVSGVLGSPFTANAYVGSNYLYVETATILGGPVVAGMLLSDPTSLLNGTYINSLFSTDAIYQVWAISNTFPVSDTLRVTGTTAATLTTFGQVIEHVDDLVAISQPQTVIVGGEGGAVPPSVYLYELIATIEENKLNLIQEITFPDLMYTSQSLINSFGDAIAISGDKNWIYITGDYSNFKYVFTYHLSPVTNKYEYQSTIYGDDFTFNAFANFGASLSTNYYGDTLVVGAPDDGVDSIERAGRSYVFVRGSQNFEASYTSQAEQRQVFQMTWWPGTFPSPGSNGLEIIETTTTDVLFYATNPNINTTWFRVGDPILFDGIIFGNISPNIVYYIHEITGNDRFTIALTRDAIAPLVLVPMTAPISSYMGAYVQILPAAGIIQTNVYDPYSLYGANMRKYTNPLNISVTVNGTLVSDNNYAVIGQTLVFVGGLNAGDIVNINDCSLALEQILTSETTTRQGAQFGTSVDTNKFASEILIGAPYELSDNSEGDVFRYTNGGDKYGMVIGAGNFLGGAGGTTILLNKYAVTLPNSTAIEAAAAINDAHLTNIMASTAGIVAAGNFVSGDSYVINTVGTTNWIALGAANNNEGTLFVAIGAGSGTGTAVSNKLIIQLIDTSLNVPNNKLDIRVPTDNWDSVIDYSQMISDLGIPAYTQTQVITVPHAEGRTHFGAVVKFNEFDSFVAAAPAGTRYSATTFDFKDDELDNDTIFDNNTTKWVDTFKNAGAVYMYDYLGNYNESLTNVGLYVYAQSLNSQGLVYGDQPMYGQALDFNDNVVMIGAPLFMPGAINGQVVKYENTTGITDWSVHRQSGPVVDIERIQDIQLYSAMSNTTLDNLDYMDPLQGKLLGAISENIDVVSNADPAGYNSLAAKGALIWGADKVGQLWFNTTNTRFVNYHQADVVYNSKHWGSVFPGSDVSVFSWILSNTPPALYTGPGTPYDTESFNTEQILNSAGELIPQYFFWVRNTNTVFTAIGKSLSDTILESYISAPLKTGISFFAPIRPDIYALYNASGSINANDTVLHIGYITGTNDDVPHTLFNLIRAGYADDFLPGLPNTTSIDVPESLYNKLLDSMCGVDEAGSIIPDPYLPLMVQTGILSRPRQSFFYDRFGALKNYLTYANEVLSLYPIVESRPAFFLRAVGEINPSTVGNPSWLGTSQLFYDTQAYWGYVNWWAAGYNDNTKAALQVPMYADLSTINAAVGLIVSVQANGIGKSETYVYTSERTWVRVGLQDGTIAFSPALWDYATYRLGFGDNFFDTTVFDLYPSAETRQIVRALNEEIYSNELLIHRNKSLVLLFEFIQSETAEMQNYLPWLNKTSFIDVDHTIRELRPVTVYQSDNQDFLAGYINESKPYHVVIKEFIFKYTGAELYGGNITDFDLPAQYNPSLAQFISPELVYTSDTSDSKYSLNAPIWQTQPYTDWYNNRGLSLTGVSNYPITVTTSYIALNSSTLAVNNPNGFPVSGVFSLGNETIGYASVDVSLNTLNGLTRGVNGTPIESHFPGTQIFMNLPAVLVLNSGRAYENPPRVTAVVDTSIYPPPIRDAILLPVMTLDRIQSIVVVDAGEGYMTLPEIVIEPSITVGFTSSNVNLLTGTIELASPTLITGDLIKYVTGPTTILPGGLKNNQYYYVGVLETVPVFAIALYDNYDNSLADIDRLVLLNTGTGDNYLNLVARASCISTASPIRENQLSIKFDRTTYNSAVLDWRESAFYGSYFAGDFGSGPSLASSSLLLDSLYPNIDSISSSSQAAVFELESFYGTTQTTWTGRARNVVMTYSGTDWLVIPPITANTASMLASSISGTTLTVGLFSGGPIVPGMLLTGGDLTDPLPVMHIVANISGTGSGSTWEVSVSESRTNIAVTGNTIYPGVGPTLGFYVGMPIKFIGAAGSSGIVAEVVYYVAEIVNEVYFTISETVNGPVFALSDSTISPAGLLCYVGEVTYRTFVSIDYPGISTVTQSVTGTNYLTVPITPGGNAGTAGFYSGLAVFFVGAVFGNIIENEPYYVTTVVDAQTFTISKNSNPIIVNISETVGGTNYVVCPDTWQLTAGDPVIFTNMVTGGASTTEFGNIISGVTYYINSVIDYQNFTIAIDLFSAPLVLLSALGSCIMTDQKDILPLVNAVGSMTINAGLPISPGQINSQLVTFYPTSPQYYPVTDVATQPGNLITGLIMAPVAGVNQLSIWASSRWLSDAYINMCVSSNIDYYGLIAGTLYYITDLGVVTTTVTATGAYGLTCSSTAGFYENMPIEFSGSSLGGVSLNVTYLIDTVNIDGVTFTIHGLVPTVEYGSMAATGQSYLIVSETMNGNPFILNPTGWAWGDQATITQYVPYSAVFDISFIRGGYRTTIVSAGEGYAVGNTLVVHGNQIGGHTPTNDLTFTVTSISKTTTITATWSAANSPYGYDGVVCLSNSILNWGDPIIFTGSAIGNIIPGKVYYVTNVDVNGVYISISETYDGLGKAMLDGIGTMLLTDDGVAPITLMSSVGIPEEVTTQYYLKVVGASECELYSDQKMTQPVNVASFPYKGIATTDVIRTNLSFNTVTITNATPFVNTDPVVFTGAVFGGIEVGKQYNISEFFWTKIGSTTGDNTISGANTIYSSWGEALALTVGDQVSFATSGGNLIAGVIYYVIAVIDNYNFKVSATAGGPVFILVDAVLDITMTDLSCFRITTEIDGPSVSLGNATGLCIMSKAGDYVVLPEPFYFDQSLVRFNHQIYQCIISNNDPTFVFGKWELVRSDDIKINALDRIFGYYQPTVNMPGLDYTQLVNGVSYPNGAYKGNAFDPNQEFTLDTMLQDQPFTTLTPAEYVVQGDPFTAGYGPEELIPGIVSDNLTMVITTRPGTNWPVTEYSHVGYNVVSLELAPATATQVLYNFDSAVINPAQIAVFVIDRTTKMSRSLYPGIDYVMTDGREDLMVENGELLVTEGSESILTESSIVTNSSVIGWLTKTVKLNSSLDFVSANDCDILRIDVYEVGNGDQLEKSNTQTDPLSYNEYTGFNEILLNCNYSNTLHTGSGVIRPGTEPIDASATITTAAPYNAITCSHITSFVINGPISFQGNVFGGVVDGTTYYVKNISITTNQITISASRVNGIAGDTFALTANSGSMIALIQIGEGLPWTTPLVLHNGTPLLFGSFGMVTETRANVITCNTTAAMVVGCSVVFDNNIFGDVLVHHQPYSVFSIVSGNEFTLVDPNNPGNELVLPTAFGGANMIVNDYAFAVAVNGISAKIVLAASYNRDIDYLTYTVFGETLPEQYGYTIPNADVFTVQVAEVAFQLTNYMGGSNIENAIVEHNGLRLVNLSDYTIDPDSNVLLLNFVPATGDSVAVTSYNLTDRQYLHTMYGGPFNGATSINLIISSTNHAAIPFDALTTGGDFIVGQPYIINSVGTTNFMTIGAGSNTIGEVFTATGSGTGDGTAFVRYDDSIFSEYLNWLTLGSGSTSAMHVNDPVTFTAPTLGGIVAGQVYHVVGILSSTEFTISTSVGGEPMLLTSATGSMLGFINPATVSNILDITNVIVTPAAITNVTTTTVGTDILTCNSTAGFSDGAMVVFETVTGPGLGGVAVNGMVYYICPGFTTTLPYEFSISETSGGLPVTLSTDIGIMTAIVGGVPTTRVTTGIAHEFVENALIRIDSTVGSTQLNNNTYYAKIISPTVFDLYTAPYSPILGATNHPVTGINTYVSSGYAWLDGTFTLLTGVATATENSLGVNPDSITCPTTELVVGTPVLFSGTTLGGITSGTVYYVKEIFSETNFTISATYQGVVFALTNDSGRMGVTQWDQTNVDRLWVTVNGYRLPSSSLRANPNNNISILTTIVPGDVVVITSMMPDPTPNELVYIQNVNKTNDGSVYRAGPETRTWLAEPLKFTDEVIYLTDLSKITNTIVQRVPAPTEVNGLMTIGLLADKRSISQVIIYNETTSVLVDTANYFIGTFDTAPVINITSQVTEGDLLVITTIEGNLIYVFGEQIRFSIVDFAANSLSGLQRGTNGTGTRSYIPVNTTVYGLLTENRMPDPLYAQTWNDADYPDFDGDIDGGPLQISSTAGAIFLTTGVNQ